MYCIPLSSWSVRPPFVFIIPSSTCPDHILRTGSKYSFKYGARTRSTYFRYEANYTLFVVVPIYCLSLSRQLFTRYVLVHIASETISIGLCLLPSYLYLTFLPPLELAHEIDNHDLHYLTHDRRPSLEHHTTLAIILLNKRYLRRQST
jgi:hypothetical protein